MRKYDDENLGCVYNGQVADGVNVVEIESVRGCMRRQKQENALNDFLDALASKKVGELTGDSFSGIDLNGESLIGVDFCHCVFDNSIFYRCDLSRANLKDTSLQNTDFRKTILLQHADLTGATFENAILKNCDFSGADLTGTFTPEQKSSIKKV